MIGVIVSARSRSVRRDPGLPDRLQRLVGDRGVVLVPDSPEALHDATRELARQGVTRVAMHGGDGTGRRVTTAIFASWPDALPEVMWLHGGTMNTVSRSMGHRGRPEAQLRAWLAELDGGPRLPRTVRWPLICEATDRDGRALPPEVGYLFGVGIVARFIAAYESGVEPSPAKAAFTLARAVGSAFTGGPFAQAFFRGIPMRVSGDGVPWPERAWMILTIGAIDQIGLGFRPTPGAITHPGSMHAFAAASAPMQFAYDLLALYRGAPTGDPLAHDFIGKQVVIDAGEDLTYDLDGDLIDVGRHVTVRVDRPLRFLICGTPVGPVA